METKLFADKEIFLFMMQNSKNFNNYGCICMNLSTDNSKLFVYSSSFTNVYSNQLYPAIFVTPRGSSALKYVTTYNTSIGDAHGSHAVYLYSSNDNNHFSKIEYSSFEHATGTNTYSSTVLQDQGIISNNNVNISRCFLPNEPSFIVYYNSDISRLSFYNVESCVASDARIAYFGIGQHFMKCGSFINNSQENEMDGIIQCEKSANPWLEQIAFILNSGPCPLYNVIDNSALTVTNCKFMWNNLSSLYFYDETSSFKNASTTNYNVNLYCNILNTMEVELNTCMCDQNARYSLNQFYFLFASISVL